MAPDNAHPHAETTTTVKWDWDVEHADRAREAQADKAMHGTMTAFQVDRRLLKDVVREKVGSEVVRINFISSGTFHKAYLVLLADGREIVARVARRYMPRIKTESEVATMNFLRQYTDVPVPEVFHYDANPYNRLGGEYIIMSKAKGIPLAQVYHTMSHDDLMKLLDNLAIMAISLFGHRFDKLGSLYAGGPTGSIVPPSLTSPLHSVTVSPTPSSAPTPRPPPRIIPTFAFLPLTQMSLTPTVEVATPQLSLSSISSPSSSIAASAAAPKSPTTLFPGQSFHVGQIVSWPFFGTNRGDLVHPTEINRGPWRSTADYLRACTQREIDAVIRENEGKAAPHRLHLDPDAIEASRHHHMRALPGDESDESDEWDLEDDSEDDNPGDMMYRDFRRMQRGTFLVAHMQKREQLVRKEMRRWLALMEKLGATHEGGGQQEEFGLDCHDLSLQNVFVDEEDPTVITCIIDWESTTTRPLWQCSHLPAFLDSSPFTADLFRKAVARLAATRKSDASPPNKIRRWTSFAAPSEVDLSALAREWLHHEAEGIRLRMAHRFVEWDGWEEGLVDSIIGPEEVEHEWFADAAVAATTTTAPCAPAATHGVNTTAVLTNGNGSSIADKKPSPALSEPSTLSDTSEDAAEPSVEDILVSSQKRRKAAVNDRIPVFKEQKRLEQGLVVDSAVTGGATATNGHELGRRLEALLVVGDKQHAPPARRWLHDDGEESDVEDE